MATSDSGGKVLHTSTYVINNTWIIDSSATDHMTFDSKQISSLNIFHKNLFPLPMVIRP